LTRNPVKDPDDSRAVAWRKAQPLAGGNRFLALRYGLSSPAVAQWMVCPPERVLDIEQLSGVSRHELRPDVFGPFPKRRQKRLPWEPNLAKALEEYGKRKLAEALGLDEAEIASWGFVPPTLVLKVERLTGLSRHQLRPDIFGEAPDDTSEEVVAA
jgi:DNA-binding transcriptional regulator YdaS (Cro superfamily)